MISDSGTSLLDRESLARITRIRKAVGEALPPEADILVLSRGNGGLLELPVRRALHFPPVAEDTYADYYPAESSQAITLIERLRRAGAQYLLIPSTALWWLEYYTEFRQHLESRYPVVIRDSDTCIIFDLREQHTIRTAPPLTSEQLRAFIADLCAEGDTVRKQWWKEYWLDTGHVSRLAHMLFRVAPIFKQSDSILDVGSFGEWPLLLWKFFAMERLNACSLEGGYLAYGEGRLKEHHEKPKEFELHIKKVDIESDPLPFADSSLDAITSFEVLEHLRIDPVYALQQFNRVLRSGGRLVLTTPNINSYDGMLRILECDTPCIFSRYFPDRGGIGHAKEYSVRELEQLLVNCGFRISTLETFNTHGGRRFEPASQRYHGLIQFLERRGWSEALAGQHILVIAERASNPKFRYYYPLYTKTLEATEEARPGAH